MTDRATRVTLQEIAQQAAVSLATVSKVLNGRTDVSAATRGRVEDLLSVHGYRRRGTPTSSSLVELVFHELESAWSMEIIKGVEDVARAAGYSVVLTESGSRHAPAADWIDGVLQRRPVGVVLVFSAIPDQYREVLKARSIPFVIIDPAGDPTPDVPSVGSANWSGGLMATRHLIELGHTLPSALPETGAGTHLPSFSPAANNSLYTPAMGYKMVYDKHCGSVSKISRRYVFLRKNSKNNRKYAIL